MGPHASLNFLPSFQINDNMQAQVYCLNFQLRKYRVKLIHKIIPIFLLINGSLLGEEVGHSNSFPYMQHSLVPALCSYVLSFASQTVKWREENVLT